MLRIFFSKALMYPHEIRREQLRLEGLVQGVGFRPFVYHLAQKMRLSGHVQNTATGVTIEIEGGSHSIDTFKRALFEPNIPNASIATIENRSIESVGSQGFEICSSTGGVKGTAASVPPDLAVCSTCIEEMFDPTDRRYRYPFLSCAHCGPRYSITKALPYDRSNTAMAAFGMCHECRCEYEAPDNRRYHAQTIACPTCGPQLELCSAVTGKTEAQREQALQLAVEAVRGGKIVALKGLGGFHLICDAGNREAVDELRRRKRRPIKPFAVIYPTLKAVESDCMVCLEERQTLVSTQSPIVLLRKRVRVSIAENISPYNPNLGVMLPYTPLHHLLLSELGFPVVATSGNRADEPIVADEQEAFDALKGIADLFLIHDRRILRRCDDSVVRIMCGRETVLRRARGYASMQFTLERPVSIPTLAVGGALKNCVALSLQHDRVMLSPHIGNLNTPEACAVHRETVDSICKLYGIEPERVVHDQHPDYRSTLMAQQFGRQSVAVQHHYAHALACMADNRVRPPCLAVVWDGAGYGADGTVWGGEFLRITSGGYQRVAHFLPFPLPGGDAAALDPKRTALGMLYRLEGDAAFNREMGFSSEETKLLRSALQKGINCPQTSSAGRMFDAVSALTGICGQNSFEGEAAMMLEFAADRHGNRPSPRDSQRQYPFLLKDDGVIDWRPMFSQLLEELEMGVCPETIAERFHATLAVVVVAVAESVGEGEVLLSGGCFQNARLLTLSVDGLERSGFNVYWHQQVPPNDGGLALGQIMAAAYVG